MMVKPKNAPLNVNFILKGVNSIQIGVYFLLFAYLTRTLLQGFISDNSMLGMMSIEIIEALLLLLAFFLLLFSYAALFYSSRRTCRKQRIKFWNKPTKATFWVTFLLAFIVLGVLFYLYIQGLFLELTSIFFLLYGLYLLLFNFRKKKQVKLFGVVCLTLCLLTFLIPSYWYNSLLILGIGHIVYGLMVKK